MRWLREETFYCGNLLGVHTALGAHGFGLFHGPFRHLGFGRVLSGGRLASL